MDYLLGFSLWLLLQVLCVRIILQDYTGRRCKSKSTASFNELSESFWGLLRSSSYPPSLLNSPEGLSRAKLLTYTDFSSPFFSWPHSLGTTLVLPEDLVLMNTCRKQEKKNSCWLLNPPGSFFPPSFLYFSKDSQLVLFRRLWSKPLWERGQVPQHGPGLLLRVSRRLRGKAVRAAQRRLPSRSVSRWQKRPAGEKRNSNYKYLKKQKLNFKLGFWQLLTAAPSL